jgi:5-methyltetrahydrofolate--homocysteine methyltransferase
MEPILKEIYQDILEGKNKVVEANVQEALQAGLKPKNILEDGMIAAMDEVGRLFESGEFFVPEMIVSARAMQAGLAVLKPSLKESNIQSAGKIVIGTVQGDMHDIGKNLVMMMLEGAGFEILDLGIDVAPGQFVAALQAGEVDILALSALISTTLPNMQATIDAVREAGLRERVKIMIGGAPVTEGYSRQIGADGYAPDASRAVNLAKSLLPALGNQANDFYHTDPALHNGRWNNRDCNE